MESVLEIPCFRIHCVVTATNMVAIFTLISLIVHSIGPKFTAAEFCIKFLRILIQEYDQ